MRGLTLILTDPVGLDAALAIVSAHAALGAPTRLYLHDRAVGAVAKADFADALGLGVSIIACQTGLAAHAIDLSQTGDRIAAGGLVSLLAELGDDRLVTL